MGMRKQVEVTAEPSAAWVPVDSPTYSTLIADQAGGDIPGIANWLQNPAAEHYRPSSPPAQTNTATVQAGVDGSEKSCLPLANPCRPSKC
jgi:hypothetical protein